MERLPEDILSDLTRLLTGEEIARLLFCGCKLLNARFAHGGVRHFDFMLTHWTHWQYPRVVSHLRRLTILTVSCDAELVKTERLHAVDWSSMPSGLEHVSITVQTPFAPLHAALVQNSSLFHCLRSFEGHGVGKLFSKDVEVDPNWFPNLERLDLDYEHGNPSNLAVWKLPRSLTVLQGRFREMRLASEGTEIERCIVHPCWPPRLVSLSLYLVSTKNYSPSEFGRLFTTLPRDMESFKLRTHQKQWADYFEWDAFPPSLKSFGLTASFITASQIAKLPRCLTDLNLWNSTFDVPNEIALLLALPARIENFRGYHFSSTQENILAMPSTIKYIATTTPPNPTLISLLPPLFSHLNYSMRDTVEPLESRSNLDTLNIFGAQLSMTSFKFLPRNLKVLQIGCFGAASKTRFDANSLPPTLTEMSTTGVDYGARFEVLRELPKHLTRLSISGGDSPYYIVEPASSACILPQTLTYFSIDKLRIKNSYTDQVGDCSGFFANLPRGLLHLSVELFTPYHACPISCPDLVTLKLSYQHTSPPGTAGLGALLPRKLIVLDLVRAHTTLDFLTIDDFRNLPRGLTDISFDTSIKLDLTPADLPPKLSRLIHAGCVPFWLGTPTEE